VLDGVGGHLAPEEHKNPWATLARAVKPPKGNRRRRFAADTLGATPPRDGPFAFAAQGVAAVNPPKTRVRRSAQPGLPFPNVKK